MKQGIVLNKSSAEIEAICTQRKLGLLVASPPTIAFDQTLILTVGNRIPNVSKMLDPFGYLRSWDMCVVLLGGKLVADIVSGKEGSWAEHVLGDNRIPAYNSNILYCRASASARATVLAWQSFVRRGVCSDVALICAIHLFKPLVLPIPPETTPFVPGKLTRFDAKFKFREPVIKHKKGYSLVEVSPGAFVKCREGEEERTLDEWKRRTNRSE